MTDRKRVIASLVLLTLVGLLLCTTGFGGALADDGKTKPKPLSVRMGILTQTGSEFVLQSGRTTLRIAGRDFTPWLGKKVKASGIMLRKEKHKVLEVTKIEEVRHN